MNVPPFIQVFELPLSESYDMPLFEPSPLCGYSNSDVSYQLTTKSGGQAPSWVKIDPGKHVINVDVEAEQEDVYGQEFDFELQVNFKGTYEEIQAFKVLFAEKPAEPEPEPEEDSDGDEDTLDESSNNSGGTPSRS